MELYYFLQNKDNPYSKGISKLIKQICSSNNKLCSGSTKKSAKYLLQGIFLSRFTLKCSSKLTSAFSINIKEGHFHSWWTSRSRICVKWLQLRMTWRIESSEVYSILLPDLSRVSIWQTWTSIRITPWNRMSSYKYRTMGNAQKHNICINISSSQTFRSYSNGVKLNLEHLWIYSIY
jgi:hypothetical protein